MNIQDCIALLGNQKLQSFEAQNKRSFEHSLICLVGFSYMSRLGLNGSDTSLPPSARTLTVLHLVSDAIRNDPNGDIPNSAAKLQRIFGLCKKKTKLFNGLWPIINVRAYYSFIAEVMERRIFGTAKFLAKKKFADRTLGVKNVQI